MAIEPLNELVLGSSSIAEDLNFIALDDLAKIRIGGSPLDFRLIGGQMVSLHVQRWRMGPELYRSTQDADIGVMPLTVKSTDLLEQLVALDYRQVEGNRFTRSISDPGAGESGRLRNAVIDILVPAFTRRARQNLRVGEKLVTTEVLGLAEPFLTDPVVVMLHASMTDGTVLRIRVPIPDEASALVLKAFAWNTRTEGKDAVDIWRMLEVAALSGLRPEDFEGDIRSHAAEIIQEAFSDPTGLAQAQLGSALGESKDEAGRLGNRIRALINRVLG
jgi:hypothetical protein